MSRAQLVRASAVAVVAASGLVLMSRFGALQWPSVLVYSGIVAFLGGMVSALAPPRWLGFSRRFHGPLAGILVGACLFCAGLYWPAGAFDTPSPATRLDAFMPDYNFHERHEIVVHAPPNAVRAALDHVAWADLGVMETLGRIRSVAMGGSAARGGLSPTPIVDSVKSPRSGFFLLDDTPREFVFGLAGQPWNNAAVRLTAAGFRTWSQPGSIRVAANFLIQAVGNDSSRVVTETRIAACDAASRRKMAQYWALVYPGSGMVRRSLLEAVRLRAEKSRT
ncbi:MAG TPA: hypothetical protein VMJ75_08925 [Candidatus Acidoferrales bacterium]|nr:hypothetical protein [Candidatus Acidoferrales bacterium]HTS66396.1 hypothetical protein [Candidatus Acidoferrales bacterium]